MTAQDGSQAKSAGGTLQYVVLDRLLRPIGGLAYRVAMGPQGEMVSGTTDAYGLTLVLRAPADTLARFQVAKASGGYKEIHRTRFAGTAKVISAMSPAVRVDSATEPHDGSGQGQHPQVTVDGEDLSLAFLDRFDGTLIEDADYEAAATTLGCETAAIRAVAETESGSSGSFFRFPDWDVVPAILYERHYFHQLTGGEYDSTHPDLSSRNPGGYGKYSAQYRKLIRAYQLAPEAALKSASWGKFQIMGRWHAQAGYASVESFVKAISVSEKNHLGAFVSFIQADARLAAAVVDKDWLRFALVYNGPGQDGYDLRMKEAYERLAD